MVNQQNRSFLTAQFRHALLVVLLAGAGLWIFMGALTASAAGISEASTPSDVDALNVARGAGLTLDKVYVGYTENGSASISFISAGDMLNYVLTATNVSGSVIPTVTVTDELTAQSITCSGTPAGSGIAAGGTCVLEASYTLTQIDMERGIVTNNGVAESATDRAEDTEVVNIPGVASISLDKSVTDLNGGDVEIGDTLEYSFTVRNNGSFYLTPVSVTDPLTGLSSVDCGGLERSTDTIDEVRVGYTVYCTATYVVTKEDAIKGSIENSAKASGEAANGDIAEDTDQVTIAVKQVAAIALDKTLTNNADGDKSGTVTLGDMLTYTLSITNMGDAVLNTVLVTDSIATAVVCPSVTALQPSESMACTATYSVTQTDVDNGKVVNEASVSATASSGDMVSAKDTESTDIDTAFKPLSVGITDPYECGGNINGSVVGGTPEFTVTLVLTTTEDVNVMKTFTVPVNADGAWELVVNYDDPSDPNYITPGKYTNTYTVVDGANQTDSDSYELSIEQCLKVFSNALWLDTDLDKVRDADEPGLVGVTVTLFTAQGNKVAETFTAADGSYEFTVAPGDYKISFQGSSNFDLPDGQIPVTLTAGSNNIDVAGGIGPITPTALDVIEEVGLDIKFYFPLIGQ